MNVLIEFADAPLVVLALIKVSAFLMGAWLAHALLVGRNPRWRVALWRSTVVGLVLVAVLSAGPPILTYQRATKIRAPVETPPTELKPAFVQSTAIPATRAFQTNRAVVRGR